MSDIKTVSYFHNEEVSLVQLSDGAKEFWVKVGPESKSIQALDLIKDTSENINGNEINVRTFEDGELRFDSDFGKFQHDEGGHIVLNSPVEQIPTDLEDSVKNYIAQ